MHRDPTQPVLRDDLSIALPWRAESHGTIGDGIVVLRPGDDDYVDALRAAIASGTLDAADTERAYQWIRFSGGPEGGDR